MRLKNLLMPVGMLAASLVLLTANDARACSFDGCWLGALVPASGDVPASLPGFLWAPQNDPAHAVDPTKIELVLVTAAGETPVAATATQVEDSGRYFITPAEPLLPNADYVMRAAQFCYGEAPLEWPTQAIVHTTEAAALPTTLGTVKTYAAPEGPLNVATANGTCSIDLIAVSRRVEIALSEEAAPWKNVLVYETLVDGQTWRPSGSMIDIAPLGGSWKGRGQDLVFTACGGGADEAAFEVLAEGMHTVQMRATIPGTSVALETELVEFELACPQSTPGEPELVSNESSCSVAAPGAGAQAAAAAAALVLGLAAAGARKRRARGRA